MSLSQLTSQFVVTDDMSAALSNEVQVGLPPRDDPPLGLSIFPQDMNVDVSHTLSKYSQLGQVSSIHTIVFTMSARAFNLVSALPECM